MNCLANSSILLTGGTGSFGRTFAAMTLEKFNPRRLVVYSRDEMKQWEMARHFADDKRVRFFIGDVRDADRLTRALDGIDYVVHAAALKIVPTAEYNPFECVKTNIIGAMNLIDVCINRGVKRVVALSTDKASAPVNLYGATKLVSDKLFVAGNAYAGGHDTRFAVVRYGNVMGSRGSVIPLFISLAGQGPLPITVRKAPSMKIVDIARAVDPKSAPQIVGIRPGEKLHEQMISAEDAPYTFDYGAHYKIMPAINTWGNETRVKTGLQVAPGFVYRSDTNGEWMTVDALRAWIENNRAKLGQF